MKKILFILTTAIAMIFAFATSCKDDKVIEEEKTTLSISPATAINFPAEGGTETITVVTNKSDWTVASNQSWCVVSTDNDRVHIYVDANDAQEPQPEAVITIAAGSGENRKTATVKVNQAANSYTPPEYEGVEYKLAPKTRILEEENTKKVESHDADNKQFVYGSGVPDIPNPGQQIIINRPTETFPYGLLAKVTDVKTADGKTTVKYEYIKLEDAFKTLRINEKNINLSNAVERVLDANGNEVAFTHSKSVKSSHALSLNLPEISLYNADKTLGAKFKMKAEFSWDNFEIEFEDKTLTNFDVKFSKQFEYNMTMEGNLRLGSDDENNKSLIATTVLTGIPIGPVVVVPFIDVYGILGAEGKIIFTAEVSYKTKSETQIYYADKQWHAGTTSIPLEDPTKPPFGLNGKIALSGAVYGGIIIEPAVGIYYKAFYFSTDITGKLQLGGTVTFDSKEFQGLDAWYNAFKDSKISTDLILEGAAHVKSLGVELAQVVITAVNKPIVEGYVVPHFKNDIKLTSKDASPDFEVLLSIEKDLLLPAKVGIKLYEGTLKSYNKDKPIKTVTMGEHWRLPEDEKYVEYKGSLTGLEGGKEYVIAPYFSIFDIEYAIKEMAIEAKPAKPIAFEKELKAILRDIYNSCTESQWKEQHKKWVTNDPIGTWEDILVETSETGEVNMLVDINEYKGVLKINNHTSKTDKVNWGFQTQYYGENDIITSPSITITEDNFVGFGGSGGKVGKPIKLQGGGFYFGKAESIVIHSKKIENISFYDSKEANSTKLNLVDLNNCEKLYGISIYNHELPIKTILLKDCPELAYLNLAPELDAEVSLGNIDFSGSNKLRSIEIINSLASGGRLDLSTIIFPTSSGDTYEFNLYLEDVISQSSSLEIDMGINNNYPIRLNFHYNKNFDKTVANVITLVNPKDATIMLNSSGDSSYKEFTLNKVAIIGAIGELQTYALGAGTPILALSNSPSLVNGNFMYDVSKIELSGDFPALKHFYGNPKHEFTISGTLQNLETLSLGYSSDDKAFEEFEFSGDKVPKLKELYMPVKTNTVELSGKFEYLEKLYLPKMNALTLSADFDALEELALSSKGLSSLVLSGSFYSLKKLKLDDNNLTALNLPPDNFPALMNLSCANNQISATVPPIFNYIRSSGGSLSYDIRYEYEYDDEEQAIILKKDNKIGFWYPHEPGGGCHNPKPCNE